MYLAISNPEGTSVHIIWVFYQAFNAHCKYVGHAILSTGSQVFGLVALRRKLGTDFDYYCSYRERHFVEMMVKNRRHAPQQVVQIAGH